MTTRQQRDFLKVHLLETQRMREMVGDHPVMSIALAERELMFSEQLAAISLESGDSLSDMSPLRPPPRIPASPKPQRATKR